MFTVQIVANIKVLYFYIVYTIVLFSTSEDLNDPYRLYIFHTVTSLFDIYRMTSTISN